MKEIKSPEANATAEFMTRFFSDTLQNHGIEPEIVVSIMNTVVSGLQLPEMHAIDSGLKADLEDKLPAVFDMDEDRMELARIGLEEAYGTCLIAAGLSIRHSA